MTERGAITAILRGIFAIFKRQDEDRAAFEAQFLQEFGDVKRVCERNLELLTEIHSFLGQIVQKQEQLRTDFNTHLRDKVRHVA